MSHSLWALTLVKLIKFFTLIFAVFVEKLYSLLSHSVAKIYDQNNLIQYGRRRHVEFTSGLHFDTFSRLGRQNIPNFVQIGQYFAKLRRFVYFQDGFRPPS